jgi:hypothetical protein
MSIGVTGLIIDDIDPFGKLSGCGGQAKERSSNTFDRMKREG